MVMDAAGGRLHGASAEEPVAALAEQQIQEWADEPEHPDDEQPEQLFRAAEVVVEDHQREDDVPQDWDEDNDQRDTAGCE